MEANARQLNQLIEIARDGEAFYKAAAGGGGRAPVGGFFIEQAQLRRQLIEEIAERLRAAGEQPSQDRWGAAWPLYASVLASVRSDNEATYIDKLESTENRLLPQFEAALDAPAVPGVKPAVQEFLGHAQQAH